MHFLDFPALHMADKALFWAQQQPCKWHAYIGKKLAGEEKDENEIFVAPSDEVSSETTWQNYCSLHLLCKRTTYGAMVTAATMASDEKCLWGVSNML